MTRPSRYPVDSFGPELMAALVKGSREIITIPCPDAATLLFLQQRIHMLRGAMGREKHPNYTLVQRARTSRMWDEPDGKRVAKPTKAATNFRLIIQPNDHQFADLIKQAGVDVDEGAMRDVLEDKSPSTPSDPSLNTDAAPSEPQTLEMDPYASFKN